MGNIITTVSKYVDKHVFAMYGLIAVASAVAAFVGVNFSPIVLSAQPSHKDLPVVAQIASAKASAIPATDRILVKFKQGISDSVRQDVLRRHEMIESFEIGSTGVKIVKIKPEKDPKAIVEKLNSEEKDKIEFAETDDLVSVELTPNDTYYSVAWHLDKIRAPETWDLSDAGNTRIAVCDTGVLANHPDLVDVLESGLGYNTVDNSTNWEPIHYHGTLVAGAAAATVNNGIGVAGTAYNARVIPVRITNTTDGNAYVSDAAECIAYASDNQAKVINLSYRMASYSTIHTAALNAESKGAVTIVAAGNDNVDPGWSDFNSFLAVAATDQVDAKAGFSSYGTYIDIAAPGVSIVTTSSDGSYSYASGTSLAAPVVAGAAALIAGADPSATAAEIKTALLASADDLGDPGEDIVYGAGRLNVINAVSYILGITPPSPEPTATPQPTATPVPTDFDAPTAPSNLTWEMRAETRPPENWSGNVIRLAWEASTDNVGIDTYNIYRNGTKVAQTEGYRISYSDKQEDLTLGEKYEYYVTASDLAGNESPVSNTIWIIAADNNNAVYFGTVRDAQTGEPLPGANITIQGNTRGKKAGTTTSDSQGEYAFIYDSVCDCKVTASIDGYDSLSIAKPAWRGSTYQVDFELSASTKGSGGGGKNDNTGGGGGKKPR